MLTYRINLACHSPRGRAIVSARRASKQPSPHASLSLSREIYTAASSRLAKETRIQYKINNNNSGVDLFPPGFWRINGCILGLKGFRVLYLKNGKSSREAGRDYVRRKEKQVDGMRKNMTAEFVKR